MTLPLSPVSTKETPLTRLRSRRHLRVFPVADPATIFVRGSQCRVSVIYHEFDHVEVYASLYAAFGTRLIVEQDEAGVYVVVRRRRLLGLFSRSEITIKLPGYCHLVFTLTPGEVRVEQVQGTVEIPPVWAERPAVVLEELSAQQPYEQIGSGQQR